MKAWLEKLHTGAQWYNIPEEKRTPLQRVAGRTRGLITLGNAATIFGAGLTLLGLSMAFSDSLYVGAALVAVGRLLDIFDGHIARSTKTSSPFGEGLDAAFDKLTSITALVLLLSHVSMPVRMVFILLLAEEFVMVFVTLWARRRGIVLHPTRLGKYTTFGIWTAIVILLLGFALFTWETLFLGLFIFGLGLIVAITTLIFRGFVLGQYLQTISKIRRLKER